jgi:hypothetical protein
MLINPRIQHFIHSKGIIEVNLAQWIRFLDLPNGNVKILNVYVPNTLFECIDLYQALCRMLSIDCQWIAARDWNMVEDAKDKSTARKRLFERQV